MDIGYVRVSSVGQNTDRQEVTMQELNVEKVFIDKCSGKDTNRPQLQEMMSFVREGDRVIVSEISRFARNTKDLLELVDQLTKKGVKFVSKKENIDTDTDTGRFMLTVFGAIGELERAYIRSRQQEGIELKKARGEYKGRKPIEVQQDSFEKEYRLWKDGHITARECMSRLNLKPNTFYRRVKEFESK